MSGKTHYSAFISYRHTPKDIETAKHIQKKLERYRIPASIQKEYGIRKFDRLFRDQEELEITDDLSAKIAQALDNSDYLIVICSPQYNQSKWCLMEIDSFLEKHDRSHVLCVLSDGEPPAIFPKTLCEYRKKVIDEDGNESYVDVNCEPLACDYRGDKKEADRIELPRLACALIGCGYDELVMRQEKYRRKRLAGILTGLFTAAFIAISYLLYSNARISENFRLSQINESRLLSREALNYLDEADRYSSLQSALKALEGRPETDDAVYALNKAVNAYLTPYQYRESFRIDASADIGDFFISRNGMCVVYLDSDKIFRCIDLKERKEISSFTLGNDVSAFEEGDIGKLIAYRDGCLVCVDYLSGETEFEMPMKYQTIGISHRSSSGNYIGTADSFALQITDDEGVPFLSLPLPDELDAYMTDFCWSKDDRYLAAKLRDSQGTYSIGVFDFETSQFRQVSERRKQIVAFGFLDEGRLYIVDDDNQYVSSSSDDTYTRVSGNYRFAVYDPWELVFEKEIRTGNDAGETKAFDCGDDICLVLCDHVQLYDRQGLMLQDHTLKESVIRVLNYTETYLNLVTADGYRGTLFLEDGSSSMTRCFPSDADKVKVSSFSAMVDPVYVCLKDGILHFYQNAYDDDLEIIGNAGFHYPPESCLSGGEHVCVKAGDQLIIYQASDHRQISQIALNEGDAYHLLCILNEKVHVLRIDAKSGDIYLMSCPVDENRWDQTKLMICEPYIAAGYFSYPLSRAETIYFDSKYDDVSSICLTGDRLYVHDGERFYSYDLKSYDHDEFSVRADGYSFLDEGRQSPILISDDREKLLVYGVNSGVMSLLLHDMKTGETKPLPDEIGERRIMVCSDVIAYGVKSGVNVCDRNGELLYQIVNDNSSIISLAYHDGKIYCISDDHMLNIYSKGELIRSVKLSFNDHSYSEDIPFRYSFIGDRLYLYNDDCMEVISLNSDSSMPVYYVNGSVLTYREKEDEIYIYGYEPALRDLDYHVGVFRQYDTDRLIEKAKDDLSRYGVQ